MTHLAQKEHQSPSIESSSKDAKHHRLIISQQPPPTVFSDEWFQVGFDLSLSYLDTVPTDAKELCANLHENIEGQYQPEPIKQQGNIDIQLATQSSNVIALTDSSIVVECKIKSDTVKDGKPVYYNINFFQRLKSNGEIIKEVEGIISATIQVVSYKISLECKWGYPIVFYKDEGGKDKHLQMTATLYGNDGCIAKGQHVPLNISLIYDNEAGSKVLKESEILRFLDSSKHYIDPDSGQSTIKFRIEDVSKNHQGLKFRALVAPSSSRCANVGYAVSPGISVRSKRNKRNLMMTPSSPSRKKVMRQIVHDSPMSLSQNAGEYASCANTLSPSRKESKSAIHHPEDINLSTAIHILSDWTLEVTRILPTLNWTLLGYCQNPDGSVDYSKPNHLMPYPNDCIKRLMNAYSSNVYSCIEKIKEEVDHVLHTEKNDSIVDREGVLPFKRNENIPKSPIHPNLHMDAKKGYHNHSIFTFPTNFVAPITPLSPAPLNHQELHHLDEERKRSSQQTEMEWSKRHSRMDSNDSNLYNHEQLNKIEYILAKNFYVKGEKIGFPVCDVNKELLGFLRESEIGEGKFCSIATMKNIDGRMAVEVKRSLEEAIKSQSDAVHRLQDCGTIASLFDHGEC